MKLKKYNLKNNKKIKNNDYLKNKKITGHKKNTYNNLKNKNEIIEDEKNIYIIIYKIKKYKINKKISKNIIEKIRSSN